MEPAKGIEPPTYGLRKQNGEEPRFFRPLLGATWGKKWESVGVVSGLPTMRPEPLGSTSAVRPLHVNLTTFVIPSSSLSSGLNCQTPALQNESVHSLNRALG